MVSYLVLARKWRPQTFEEIVGQPHVVTTLRNAITMNRVAHSYLLSGPRGVGKTSTARVLAKALNCKKGMTIDPCNTCVNCTEIWNGSSMDVLEIDGASNRGIDQVRELRDNVKFSPASCRFKVYIIDEVHMLTQEAFNALLKTLEEPPAHVKFVFATTEAHRVPATILSRCQRFDLRKISTQEILAALKEMVKKEKMKADDKILFAVAKMGDGSLRDAESLLDQLIAFSQGDLRYDEALNILGCIPREKVIAVLQALKNADWKTLFGIIREMDDEGKDLSVFVREVASHFRDLLVLQMDSKDSGLVELSEEDLKEACGQVSFFSRDQLLQMLEVSLETEDRLKNALSKRFMLEALAVRLFLIAQSVSLETLIKKVESIGLTQGKPILEKAEEAPAEEALKKNESFSPSDVISTSASWEKFLASVAGRKPLLHAYLREAAVEQNGNRLRLLFHESKVFFMDALKSQDAQKLVREEAAKVFGVGVIVELGILPKESLKKEAATLPLQVRDTNLNSLSTMAIQDDPMVQRALEIFQGKITEIKR